MKLRKDLKDTWAREQKKLSECKAAMKASKTKYTMLGQELARVSFKSMYAHFCKLSTVSTACVCAVVVYCQHFY